MPEILKRGGRPRAAGLDEAILDAAVSLMSEVGYRGMSLEAVARRAGTTKPSIYLRFGGKEELAVSALERLRLRGGPAAETGSLRGDLVAELERFRRAVLRPHGMAMVGTVLAEETETPELLARFRDGVVRPRRRLLCDALERGRSRGEIAVDEDFELVASLLVGAVYAQYLAGTPFSPGWSEHAVDLVLKGGACG
ncbi:MAG TPA: TetR/AcrR family transcriptional regulator [Thermoleophilia bacterium]|nr:TetR/AcrR family transcriptional regulator [Thermoleophilia bacterium]